MEFSSAKDQVSATLVTHPGLGEGAHVTVSASTVGQRGVAGVNAVGLLVGVGLNKRAQGGSHASSGGIACNSNAAIQENKFLVPL